MKQNGTTKHMFGALALAFIAQTSAVSAAELLMIREKGCFWCEAWDKDVSAHYGDTLEGQSAPLREAELGASLDEALALKGAVLFTPTFLLIEDGKEVGRIEGYPGADFFWGQLGEMLNSIRADVKALTEPSG